MSRKIKLGTWYFKLNITLSIVVLAVFCIFVYLGTWQLNRAIQKQSILLQMQQQLEGAPIKLAQISDPNLTKLRFTPVIVSGTYLNQYTFLLDNQILNSQVGYRVLTVVQSPVLEKWVLIDRGWVGQGSTRKKLPEIKDIYGVKDLIGIINTIPTGILLQKDIYDPNAKWPLVIQNLDFEYIAEALHHPVYDFLIQLRTSEQTTYVIPPIDLGIPSNKHLMYAFQWFFFAGLVIVYYCIMSFVRKES